MATGHAAARATWPWRKQVSARYNCSSLGKKVRESESTLLISLGVYYLRLEKDHVIFQKKKKKPKNNFPSFYKLFIGLPPRYSNGLFGQASPVVHTNYPVPEGESSVHPLGRAMLKPPGA